MKLAPVPYDTLMTLLLSELDNITGALDVEVNFSPALDKDTLQHWAGRLSDLNALLQAANK